MSELVESIDELLAYLRERPKGLTREEADVFESLSRKVRILARKAGLLEYIPKQEELDRESYSPNLPPPQFLGTLNLPGDWIDQGKKPARFEYVIELPYREKNKRKIRKLRWLQSIEDLREEASSVETVEVRNSSADSNRWFPDDEIERLIRHLEDEGKMKEEILEVLIKFDGRFERGEWTSTEIARMLNTTNVRGLKAWKKISLSRSRSKEDLKDRHGKEVKEDFRNDQISKRKAP